MKQLNGVGWMLVILLVVVLVSGCLSPQEQNNGTTITGSSSSQSNTLSFPNNVTFTVILTVKSGDTILQNYSYSATIDYTLGDAVIERSVIYHPQSTGLYGNWHKEKIVIKNRTSFRVFVVPPAIWMPEANNSSAAINLALYSRNPYYVLWHFVNSSSTVGGSGEYDVVIPDNISRELLSAVNPRVNLPDSLSLTGVVVTENGVIQSAELHGCVNSTCYSMKLEVKG